VCVIAVHPDDNARHQIEDAMVGKIKDSVASYTFVPHDVLRDRDKVVALVQASPCDGAIAVRVLDPTKDQSDPEARPNPSTTMWTDTAWSSSVMVDPDYFKAAKEVLVDTRFYAVKSSKLVWQSRSDTMNPSSVNKLIESVVRANVQKLQGENII